jgi:Ca2+-binding EF-hand superfamily protein
MNSFRVNIVKSAYKKLDKDGSGLIDINDIRGVYSAKTHPDVKSGKKTEDEVLGEFLETFELHHSMNGGGSRDRSVTIEEFLEYYNNVSASIDND